MVVLTHTAAPIVGGGSPSSLSFIIGNIANGISRIGVPVFFMISGALMLDERRELNIRLILKKYVKNIAILLVCWSVFYACLYEIIVPLFINNEAVSFSVFLLGCINGATHLWFLFVIIGLYLITPFLRMFVKKQHTSLVFYFIVLAGVFLIIPNTIDPIIGFIKPEFEGVLSAWLSKFSMGFVMDCTVYYLLGWYITNKEVTKKVRCLIYILGVLSLIYTILSVQLFSKDGMYIGEKIHNNLTMNVILYATSVFLFFWYKFKDASFTKARTAVIKLSSLTFGVYLVHIAVLYLLGHFLLGQQVFIRLLVGWVLSLLCSFGIAFVMSKIPFIKKLIRG